jgi:hypothetical protein
MPEGITNEQAEAERQRRLEAIVSVDVEAIEATKGRTRFRRERPYLRAGHGQYETVEALVAEVSKSFPSERIGSGLRGKLTRVGKYTRVTETGDKTFTFGDPILDLITDDHGNLRVGGRDFRPYVAELAMQDRGGGISSIAVADDVERVRDALRIASLSGETRFSVLEDEGEDLILASRNPHELWFYRGSTKMRFRAFRKSYFVYIKMGADIETWGQDFRRASISSTYGSFVSGLSQCFAVGSDSDSDTNDDYVDEYEWFLGGGVESGFDGVRSSCVATWHDRVYPGTVEYGCVIADV